MAVTIRGFAEFESKLRSLALVSQRILLERAAKAGAILIRDRAADLAPTGETGRLQDSMIVVTRRSENTKDAVVTRIGPAKGGFYGLFQEIGTAHHTPQPFLLPAYEETKDDALDAASDKLREAVLKAAK